MKTPRVQDFDPNVKVPELGSPMDNLPAIQKPLAKPLPSHVAIKENQVELINPYARTPVRSSVRTPVRRQLTRYAFEFYQDQVEDLRHISLEEKLQGGKGNMSEIVRKAVDEYLSKIKQPSK